jgi:DNA primase
VFDHDTVVKARSVSVAKVVENLKLRRSGRELVGPCPVCGGTDRFSVNTVKQLWLCRGCGKSGDVIALACAAHPWQRLPPGH